MPLNILRKDNLTQIFYSQPNFGSSKREWVNIFNMQELKKYSSHESFLKKFEEKELQLIKRWMAN